MFEKNALHVRLKNASVELILSWLDKWKGDGSYNFNKEDENIILDREAPLLDAALAEYTSHTETLAKIYSRGDISLKKACLKNDNHSIFFDSDEWPYKGTFQALLNEADIKNGLLECLVKNPKFDFGYAIDIFEKENEFSGIDDNIWRHFVSLLSCNPLMRKAGVVNADYENYDIKLKLWKLSESLPVTQTNADFLYNLYTSLGHVTSDDPKQERMDLNEVEKDIEREFVVERGIKRWESFLPEEENIVRQGFFLIKGHSGDDICRQLLKNLEDDTVYFHELEHHEVAYYREYFYKNVERWNFNDDNTEILDTWFEKDGGKFLDSVCQNYSIVSGYYSYKWLESKIEKLIDRDERELLKQKISYILGSETRLPDHLKHEFDLSSVAATDAERFDRLERQVDLIFKNLMGLRDINDDHTLIGENATLSVIAQNLGFIKHHCELMRKNISFINKLVISSLVLIACILGGFMI